MPKKRLTPIARKLRQQQTEAEKLLWSRLRKRQLENAKFRRQMPIDNFVADFCCPKAKLIIELDGSQHSESPSNDERTRKLGDAGYIVLRYWNSEVFENLEGVLEGIRQALLTAKNT
ncbi:MAG: DUF559 domain-containing protein [Sphingorhabdus sp.]